MKKLLLLIYLTLASLISFGQVWCGGIAIPEDWNFDDGFKPWDYLLQIDTVSNPNNIWQIGAPQKTVINSAYSSPNVIITDTTNYYPPNDTSVFIFKHIDQGGYSAPHSAELAGFYQVNSDSLHDFGTIEISLDHGTTWINLISDTVYTSYYYWFTPKPTLTGNSNGWVNFHVMLAQLGIPFSVNWGDTILLKFTFISDSIADNLDGLAFDNFQFCDGVEGINEILNDNLIVIYPNPTTDILYVNRRTQQQKESIRIIDHTGQLVYEDSYFKSKVIDLSKLNLTPGLYSLRYSNSMEETTKQFILQR